MGNCENHSEAVKGNCIPLIQGPYPHALSYCDSIFGHDSYFEFCLSYVSEQDRFTELNRFIWESKHLLRFKNEYEGNVVIDISEWNAHSYDLNEYFDAFLYYLKSREKKIRICLIANDFCEKELVYRLQKIFDLQTVILPTAIAGKSKTKIGFSTNEGRTEDV